MSGSVSRKQHSSPTPQTPASDQGAAIGSEGAQAASGAGQVHQETTPQSDHFEASAGEASVNTQSPRSSEGQEARLRYQGYMDSSIGAEIGKNSTATSGTATSGAAKDPAGAPVNVGDRGATGDAPQAKRRGAARGSRGVSHESLSPPRQGQEAAFALLERHSRNGRIPGSSLDAVMRDITQTEARLEQREGGGQALGEFRRVLRDNPAMSESRVEIHDPRLRENGRFTAGVLSGQISEGVRRLPMREAVEARQHQQEFLAEAQRVTGRADFNPRDAGQVREYMSTVARRQGVEGVQTALHNYLDSFYVHAGDNVDYLRETAEANVYETGSPNIGEIQQNALRDGADRAVIDCDGLAGVAREVLQDTGYHTRWTSMVTRRGGHMVLPVFDPSANRGFVVNNTTTSNGEFQLRPHETIEAGMERGVRSSVQAQQGYDDLGQVFVEDDYLQAITGPYRR